MAWVVYYTASGVYDSLFTNSSGCDSLVVLDLTIYPILHRTDTM